MFTNVIAAVDGFDGGRDAVALARALTDGRLTLVGVHPDDAHRTRASLEGYWRAQHDDVVRALEAARAEAAIDAEILAVGDPSPGRALHRVAEERGADLLVLGSAHHGPAGRLVAGDVTRAALHGAPCPVAIAPKRFRARGPHAIEVVAVGFDGSPEARAALQLGLAVAAGHGARLRLLVAWDDPSPVLAATASTQLDMVRITEEHRALAADLLAATLRATPEAEGALVHGKPGEALAAAAEEADLLVAGSRGWGPVRRLALGSTSDFLLHHAPCPVLLAPRPAEVERERAGEAAATERVAAGTPTAAAAG